MEIKNVEHQHQITNCMYHHKHRLPDGDIKAGAADVPNEAAVSMQESTSRQGIWQYWKQLVQTGLKFGKGQLTVEKEGITAQTPQEESEKKVAADKAAHSTETNDTSVQKSILSIIQLAALVEPIKKAAPKAVVWLGRKVKKVAGLAAGIRTRYFGTKHFGESSKYNQEKSKEQLLQSSAQQKKNGEQKSSYGTFPGQDYLLDSYNKSGEYTELMK